MGDPSLERAVGALEGFQAAITPQLVAMTDRLTDQTVALKALREQVNNTEQVVQKIDREGCARRLLHDQAIHDLDAKVEHRLAEAKPSTEVKPSSGWDKAGIGGGSVALIVVLIKLVEVLWPESVPWQSGHGRQVTSPTGTADVRTHDGARVALKANNSVP